jgi:hypothetical protein
MSVAIESQVVSRSTQARIARLLNSQDRHHAISETMSVGDQNHRQAFQFTEWRPDAIEQSLSQDLVFFLEKLVCGTSPNGDFVHSTLHYLILCTTHCDFVFLSPTHRST